MALVVNIINTIDMGLTVLFPCRLNNKEVG